MALASLKSEIVKLRQRSETAGAIRSLDGGGSATVGDLDTQIAAAYEERAAASKSGHYGKIQAADARLAKLQKARYS